MAQPTAFVPATDYSGYQATNPDAPFSGALMDADLAAIQLTTDQVRANLALLQRDDGALLNGLVTPFSMSAAALALIASAEWTVASASWATATSYPQYQLVRYDAGVAADGTYLSATAHTSGTFATDLAAGKWILIALETGGVVLPLAINQGGTASTTASDAADALGLGTTDNVTHNNVTATGDIAGVGLTITGNAVLGNAAGDSLTSNGKTMSLPNIPAFSAIVNGVVANQTGDGTAYTIIFGTEIFDQGGDYANGTGIFTAPQTGRYRFSGSVGLEGLLSGHTSGSIKLVTSNRTYFLWAGSPWSCANAAAQFQTPFSVLADMDAADTASVVVTVAGSTKVVDVTGDATTIYTRFDGELVA